MPLFVFISGRFSHTDNKQKYKKNILRPLETYIVFQIITSTILIIRNNEFSYKYLYEPNWILWYLISLFLWRSIIYLVPSKWLVYRKQIILISFTISILAGFIPVSYEFALQKSLAFLPFFILGYYSTQTNISSKVNKISPYIAIGTFIITFSILYFVIRTNLSPITHSYFPYWSEDFKHTVIKFIARCIYIPSSIILGLMVMRVTPSNKSFSSWGSITLFLFIYHIFVVRELLFPIIRMYDLPTSSFYLFIYSIITITFLIILSRIKILSILLNPLSYINEKMIYHNSIATKKHPPRN